MNRCILPVAVLAFTLTLAPAPANACGEGSFNMGQGLHYQGYLAPRPATVLVYDDGATDRKELYAGLQKAGHKVTVVGNTDALSQALRQRRFDVVIADLGDTALVESRAANMSATPRLLPVVARNQRNTPEVRSRFNLCVLDGASLGQYLTAINQLVSVRSP